VAVGKFDGIHPCLTAGTLAGKVFVHNPHQNYNFYNSSRTEKQALIDSSLSLLNINAVVTSLATGCLDPTTRSDSLFVGTKTHILGYDVNNNSDLFHRELNDGANAICVGTLGKQEGPVVVVGGNCAIVALNKEGDEVMWTVTGDNVCSLDLVDFNSDNVNELVVGSEDYDIRVFKDDEIICEMTETESIIDLTKLDSGRFGYALANGTVGVYEKNNRMWRIKV
jgi:Bardet-Biedl syndrome 2 protein